MRGAVPLDRDDDVARPHGLAQTATICGATGPELDLSWQDLKAADAKVVAVELKYNGALVSLDLSQNYVPESQVEQIKTACQSKGISLKI